MASLRRNSVPSYPRPRSFSLSSLRHTRHTSPILPPSLAKTLHHLTTTSRIFQAGQLIGQFTTLLYVIVIDLILNDLDPSLINQSYYPKCISHFRDILEGRSWGVGGGIMNVEIVGEGESKSEGKCMKMKEMINYSEIEEYMQRLVREELGFHGVGFEYLPEYEEDERKEDLYLRRQALFLARLVEARVMDGIDDVSCFDEDEGITFVDEMYAELRERRNPATPTQMCHGVLRPMRVRVPGGGEVGGAKVFPAKKVFMAGIFSAQHYRYDIHGLEVERGIEADDVGMPVPDPLPRSHHHPPSLEAPTTSTAAEAEAEAECSICYTPSSNLRTLPCTHKFCTLCLLAWANTISDTRETAPICPTCPFCRTDIHPVAFPYAHFSLGRGKGRRYVVKMGFYERFGEGHEFYGLDWGWGEDEVDTWVGIHDREGNKGVDLGYRLLD